MSSYLTLREKIIPVSLILETSMLDKVVNSVLSLTWETVPLSRLHNLTVLSDHFLRDCR